MIKVWKFLDKGEDDDGVCHESFHETEDTAYRAFCSYYMQNEMDDLDLEDDEEHRLFLRQFLSCVEHGDYRAAFIVWRDERDRCEWTENLYIEEVELTPEHVLDIFEHVASLRAALTEAEKSAAE